MDTIEDFSSKPSTSSHIHPIENCSNDNVIVLSSESSEDESNKNYCKNSERITSSSGRGNNVAHRKLNIVRNEIPSLSHTTSQQSALSDTRPAKVTLTIDHSNHQNNSTLQCNELLRGLHDLMREMEALEERFLKNENDRKQKQDNQNDNGGSNELLLTNENNSSRRSCMKPKTCQHEKLVDEHEHPHSSKEASYSDLHSSKRKHKNPKRKHRHRSKHSHVHRTKPHISKRKRRKCHRHCKENRSNCEIYASIQENDMKIKIRRVPFDSYPPSVHEMDPHVSEGDFEKDNDQSSVDDDSSSSQFEQFIPSESEHSTESKYTQGNDRPRNTNKNLYFKSEAAKVCRICHLISDSMTNHYKRFHKNSEVFVSRLSDEMVQKVKRGDHPAVRCDKPNAIQLSAYCYFCESEKRFPTHYWIDHIRNHTGEFAYECSICKKSLYLSRLCCSRYAVKTIKSDFIKQDFVAYVCKICNFIQISEKNIQNHLKNEHQTKKMYAQYEQVILLPAFRSVKRPILKLHDICY